MAAPDLQTTAFARSLIDTLIMELPVDPVSASPCIPSMLNLVLAETTPSATGAHMEPLSATSLDGVE